jgi:hypothetical protein
MSKLSLNKIILYGACIGVVAVGVLYITGKLHFVSAEMYVGGPSTCMQCPDGTLCNGTCMKYKDGNGYYCNLVGGARAMTCAQGNTCPNTRLTCTDMGHGVHICTDET